MRARFLSWWPPLDEPSSLVAAPSPVWSAVRERRLAAEGPGVTALDGDVASMALLGVGVAAKGLGAVKGN